MNTSSSSIAKIALYGMLLTGILLSSARASTGSDAATAAGAATGSTVGGTFFGPAGAAAGAVVGQAAGAKTYETAKKIEKTVRPQAKRFVRHLRRGKF